MLQDDGRDPFVALAAQWKNKAEGEVRRWGDLGVAEAAAQHGWSAGQGSWAGLSNIGGDPTLPVGTAGQQRHCACPPAAAGHSAPGPSDPPAGGWRRSRSAQHASKGCGAVRADALVQRSCCLAPVLRHALCCPPSPAGKQATAAWPRTWRRPGRRPARQTRGAPRKSSWRRSPACSGGGSGPERTADATVGGGKWRQTEAWDQGTVSR